jgi:hypothetical protein
MGQASKLPYAKPLPFYYSFLNLVKAFVLRAGKGISDYRPQHGVSEAARDRQVEGAMIKVYRSSLSKRNAFADFYRALTGDQFRKTKSLRLGYLLPQILFGHRLWCSAAGTRDRFVPIQKIEFIESSAGLYSGEETCHQFESFFYKIANPAAALTACART